MNMNGQLQDKLEEILEVLKSINENLNEMKVNTLEEEDYYI
ncbi:MAG: hypothetical protein ACQEP5_02810 [Actinomycetota bacterium]